MRIFNDTLVYSATDLITAATCEYAVLRSVDKLRGRGPGPVREDDALMRLAGSLGDDHETKILRTLEAQWGVGTVDAPHGVVAFPNPKEADLARDPDRTVQVALAGADVIYQAVLFDGRMAGSADFLVKEPGGPAYDVTDAKLARRAKPNALFQIAAYAELARIAGIPLTGRGRLLLGSGDEPEWDIARLAPVVADRRRRLEAVLDRHEACGLAVAWGDSSISACGRCATCDEQVQLHRDVLLVAGMRSTQRAKLRSSGIETIDQLAKYDGPEPGHEWPVPQRTLRGLREQARIQVAQMGDAGDEPGPVQYRVFDYRSLDALPTPSAGDIFFDFEGDPLWQDPTTGEWGLEYLFGVVELGTDGACPRFIPFVAHDHQQEKVALRDFLDYVARRREQHPDMHIYHYADYERAALKRLTVRHREGEDELDELLRQNVLVDLYPVVRRSVRVSQRSYSIKKLEPLYMGDELRDAEGVTNAADSVAEYAAYRNLRDADPEAAEQKLADILDYNRYDCVSTLRLRDWLLDRAAEQVIDPTAWLPPVEPAAQEASTTEDAMSTAQQEAELVDPLFAFAQAPRDGQRTPEQSAVALVAAAVGYHRREDKPTWWEHFDRLGKALDEIDDRAAMVLEDVQVVEDWHVPPKARKQRRHVRLIGQLPAGHEFKVGQGAYLLYEPPAPAGMDNGGRPDNRGYKTITVLSIDPAAAGMDAVLIQEMEGAPGAESIPTVLAADSIVQSTSIRAALREVAQQVGAALDAGATFEEALPRPVANLLLRKPPTLTAGEALPAVDHDGYVGAITEAVMRLERSCLAVQGPPGTGKTYVGSHVIKALVDAGWRVGVVSQSHAAVNHMLDKVVDAGVPASQVGKAKKRPDGAKWTLLEGKGKDKVTVAEFLATHANSGCVLGGTAWDFTNAKRVARGALDLLVIDEAGQYSLANTIAVSVSAERLLLLGDPQQLPQVSQGAHPEPVHTSALSWLLGGTGEDPHRTLPTDLGYFLDTSWRMHPQIAEQVSRHSYESRLHANEAVTAARQMLDEQGTIVEPGVFVELVDHEGNDVRSDEEVARVLDLTREVLTWTWYDPEKAPVHRPMQQRDVLVVAPYNAQRNQLLEALAGEGLADVRVGTVDKFQGQEAPVAIVSMTASAPGDVPRGMGFLLSPNRINVAVSRAQWRAVIVCSPHLTDFMPTTAEGLSDLGGFLGLGR